MATTAPPPNPGDVTKIPASFGELTARLHSAEAGKPWHQPLFNPFANPAGW